MTNIRKTTRRQMASLRTRISRVLSSPARVSAAAVALLAGAAALRVWRLDAVGFGGDEAVYAGQAAVLAHVPGMGRWFIDASRGNSNFLATQWLVSLVYRLFGVTDLGARLVSATASVMTVALVYLIARELYGGRRYALAAGLVMAVSGYAIEIGRLALLDATACFFLTAAVYCLVRWMRSGGLAWAVLGTVAESIAVQAKVTSVLVTAVAVVVLSVMRLWRGLRPWQLLTVLFSGLLASAPAIGEVVTNTGGLRSFFAASTSRTADVPWYYYPGVLWSAERPVLFALLLLAVAFALIRRRRADLLPVVWLGVYAVFLQLYPLKAFNYLLPLMPPLALLGGHLIGSAISWCATRVRLSPAALLAAAGAVLVVSQVGAMDAAVANGRFAGLREAALWLRAQGAQRAGTIALSQGSGQYVLPFYGGIDAYPYGRFRIATVMPGGRVVQPHVPRNGGVPLDWVDYWPGRLIAHGRVRYLVYQTDPLDDPPEQSQVAGTITQKQYRSFIAHYGGQLVHTVYWNHEARVYIYRVTRRLPRPVVSATSVGAVGAHGRLASWTTAPRPLSQEFVLRMRGFTFGSPLTVHYGDRVVGRAVASATGAANATVRVPTTDESRYHLIVNDQDGATASVTAVTPAGLRYSVEPPPTGHAGHHWSARPRFRRVRVWGADFKPHRPVRLYSRDRVVGGARARTNGSVSWVVRLPEDRLAHARIIAVGHGGRLAVAKAMDSTPHLAFAAIGPTAHLAGRGYEPDTRVTLTYAHRVVGFTHTNSRGAFTYHLDLPRWTRPADPLAATDPMGRTATVTGLVRR